jgi:hypothetical protein
LFLFRVLGRRGRREAASRAWLENPFSFRAVGVQVSERRECLKTEQLTFFEKLVWFLMTPRILSPSGFSSIFIAADEFSS